MDLDLATAIGGVTVYPDRALIMRQGTVQLEAAGAHALRIGGLPTSILRDSLRAAGRGPAGTRILGVEQDAEYHPAAPEETLRSLREAIAQLEQRLALVDDRKEALEEQRGWLRSLGEQAARSLAWGLARGTAKPEDAGAVFAYVADESERLAITRLDVTRQQDEIQRELEMRRREYAQLGGGTQPDRLAATIRVEMAAPGTLDVELSYLEFGASWRPRYDARVDAAAASVRLTQQALVSQKTGEDWQHVPLALSTARPSGAVRLPDEPDPWYLGVAQPAPPPQARAMSPLARRLAPMAAGAMSSQTTEGVLLSDVDASTASEESLHVMERAELASADVERSGAAQIFRVPGGVDIPSDGSPHTLGLGEYDLPCRLDYLAAPVVAPGAHLRAVAPNTTGRVLLPGELHVFHAGAAGDEYIGATRLDTTAEGADLTLFLGVDDNVTVKRELIERDTDKGSLLQSGVRRVTLGYRVTLGNRTAIQQRVQLKDRLPVPRHERIKVRVLEMKPAPTAHTRLEQCTWDVALGPGEERHIEWRLVVEAPAELEVVGLP